MSFPPVPAEIKAVAHVLKVAEEHENRNIVVTYWARMHAVTWSLKLLSGQKRPEVTKLLSALLGWLEEAKVKYKDVDGIANETVGHALIEEYAMQLFEYADGQDRNHVFNKNTIKAFYTCGMLMDVLEQFGPISDEISTKRKYAKWKAAYIHTCLKNGDIPTSGGPDEYLNNIIDTSTMSEDEKQNFLESQTDLLSKHNQDNIKEISPPPSFPGFSKPTTSEDVSTPTTPGPINSTSTDIINLNDGEPEKPTFPVPQDSFSSQTISDGAVKINIDPQIINKAQKYCKYAASALNYDDTTTAVDNLRKALNLLESGTEN